jgi:hypothetical protein
LSWRPLLENQSIQVLKICLLCSDAPAVKLPGNLGVIFVLNEEVTSSCTMIVRSDKNVARSRGFKNALLKLLLRYKNPIAVEVRLDQSSRTGIKTTQSMP